MSSNLFGPTQGSDIRVGYIDPTLGYIDNTTVCEANSYAEKNPGTVFIFKDGRNNIRYLNINEVNQLTPKDTISDESECGGVNQKIVCGPPKIQFFGGGGIGAVGNPVVGQDGSLLAVDVVRGGHGYRFPPTVSARDDCDYGSGTVLVAILGETSETYEYYDRAEDYEEYEICDDFTVGFGRMWGPNGEDLGEWNPSIYTSFTEDPIALEILEYQEIVRALDRTPFFSTRNSRPNKISSNNPRVIPSYNNVDYNAWSDFMNLYAVSPTAPSNARGTDYAGILFTFEWDLDCPVSGNYIFRGARDNKAKLYVDNIFLSDLNGFKDSITPIKKYLKEGIHKLRIELLNIPIYEKVLQAVPSPPNNKATFRIASNADFANSMSIPDLGINVSKEYKGVQINENITKDIEFGKIYEVVFNSSQGNIQLRTKGSAIIQMEDSGDNDYNDIVCSVTNGRFFGINGNKCKFTVDPPPEPKTPNLPSTESQEIEVKKVFNTVDYIGRANRPLWRTNVYGRGGFLDENGVCPFDTTVQLENNPYAGTHQINWDNIKFPVDGNYKIRIAVDDNVSLKISGGGLINDGTGLKDQLNIRKEGFIPGTDVGTPDFEAEYYFEAGTYRIEASLDQKAGGIFGFSDIKGINPMALAIDIQTSVAEVEVISAKSWNENPMGVALTIDAPPAPPSPQEPPQIQEGRCPPNPIWSTRSPGASESWYPVKYNVPNTWSRFMNRYALSPVKPLDSPGSDSAGTTFSNSWTVNIPYDGYYAVKGTRDNTGRVLIDGSEVSKLNGFKTENPDPTKIYLSEGDHTITVEVFNQPITTSSVIDRKIFRTQDWIVPTVSSPTPETVNIDFRVSSSADFANSFEISELFSVSKTFKGPQINEKTSQSVEVGKVYSVTFNSSEGNIKLRTQGKSIIQMEDSNDNDYNDLVCSATIGRFFDINGNRCKFTVSPEDVTPSPTAGLVGGTVKDGVRYEGPDLFHYPGGSDFLNKQSLSPFFADLQEENQDIVGTFNMKWFDVEFPEDGLYDIRMEADDRSTLKIDGVEIDSTTFGFQKTFKTFISKGKRLVEIDLTNIDIPGFNNFIQNPVAVGLQITRPTTITSQENTPWSTNPVAISAVLIAPPCPKKINGRGVVEEVIVRDPGNGYLPPQESDPGYPATLKLKEVIVENPGINYNCGVDQLQIEPSNGARLDYECDTFGRISKVNILNPGMGFTQYPTIRMPSDTGVNASFRPVFEIVRDPVEALTGALPQESLLQVTDLVGLKQTGYVDGRAYYGAVFYKDGVRYAGYFETAGQLIQVYDTLQESIDAQVTTPPSAIQRQGTDVNSNNPRLNLPGTPETTTEL